MGLSAPRFFSRAPFFVFSRGVFFSLRAAPLFFSPPRAPLASAAPPPMTAPQRAGRPPSPFPGLRGPKIAKRAKTRPILFSAAPFFPAAAAALSNGLAAPAAPDPLGRNFLTFGGPAFFPGAAGICTFLTF